MEEKKKIKMSLGTAVMLGIIIFLLLVNAVLIGLFYTKPVPKIIKEIPERQEDNLNTKVEKTNTKQDVNTNTKQEVNTNKKEEKNIDDIKIDKKKELVYDAEYEYDVTEDSYVGYISKETYYITDIVVPYINIKSDYVKGINKEIEKLYIEMAEKFQSELDDVRLWYIKSNYQTYINENVLSIIITTERAGTAPEIYEYYTYNIDLDTLSEKPFEDVFKKFGLETDKISKKVEDAVKNSKQIGAIHFDKKPEQYIKSSLKNYTNTLKDRSLKYFIDDKGKLNIIINMIVPYQRGEEDAILQII